jgi:hypothetical protein
MGYEFYKAVLEEGGRIILTQSDIKGRVTKTRTGRINNGEGELFQWEVNWPVPITWEDKEKKLKIGNVKIRRKPYKENEYKMHITREGGGGKLIFDDKTLGETWRRIIKSQDHWTATSLTTINLMGELGLPNLFDEIEAQLEMPQHLHQDIYLCSVDTSNRCILYKRDRGPVEAWVVWNYLYFTKFIETVKTFKYPLAAWANTVTRAKAVSSPGEFSAVKNPLAVSADTVTRAKAVSSPGEFSAVKNPLAVSADTVTRAKAVSSPGEFSAVKNPLAVSADTVTRAKAVSSPEAATYFENPLAAWDDTVTRAKTVSSPEAIAAVSPPFDQPDPPLIGNLLDAEAVMDIINVDGKSLKGAKSVKVTGYKPAGWSVHYGGKENKSPKKRKRKTNKCKYKGRKRSSRNYKSKNKKYTKRRR